jgi:vitamin B12 transporter
MNIKLKNNFTKSLLSLAIVGTFSSAFIANANTAKGAVGDLEVITVTATRSSLNINDALTSQVVIDRADIELINPISVLDLLTTVPSIDIASNGGKGQSASVFLRGTNSDHTLVLIDGIRVSSATSGTTSFNSISPELIERIEIVQGPRAALWGSDAIGGVIQIFTRKLTGGEMFAGASIGSDNYRKYKAGIGISHGEGQTSITVNHEESDGYDVQEGTETDDDGYEYTSVAIRGLQHVTKALAIDWLFTADQGETEYDGYYNGSDIKSHAWLVRADYASTINSAQINNAQNNIVFLVGQNRDYTDSLSDGTSLSIFETRRNQFSLVNNTQFTNDFQFNFGVDHYQDDVSKSTVSFDQTTRDTTGVFANTLITDNSFSYEVTIRHDKVEAIDSEMTYNLGLGYQVGHESRIVLSYGTGFKVPTFNDLYYPGSGNSKLSSEFSESAEIFFETTFADVNTSINFYHSNIEDLIAWTGTTSENIEEVQINGVEFVANYVGFGGKHDFNISYTDAEDQKTNEQLTRRAKNKANYKFTTSVADADIYAELQYTGKRTDKAGWPSKIVDLDTYVHVNLGLNYAITPELKLNARVTNLLDKEYETVKNYNTQGQAFYLGVTYQNF